MVCVICVKREEDWLCNSGRYHGSRTCGLRRSGRNGFFCCGNYKSENSVHSSGSKDDGCSSDGSKNHGSGSKNHSRSSIKTTAAAAKTAAASGSVTCSGSSALLPLVQAAAEKYMKINAGVTIAANGGGSGTGLKQVSDGAVDIGDSDVFAEEKLDAALASALKDHKVCTVTMAAVVNKSLGVTEPYHTAAHGYLHGKGAELERSRRSGQGNHADHQTFFIRNQSTV
jgi:hypothetical protein